MFDRNLLLSLEKVNKNLKMLVIPQLWVQVIQMYPYTPLWKRGARGDFLRDNFKIPLYPPLPKGDKNTCN